MNCMYCNKVCKSPNSLRNHERLCPNNKERKYVKRIYNNRVAWNKGLNKNTDERVKKNANDIAQTVRQKVKDGTFRVTRMGPEARQKLSEEQSLKNRGGKCKWFEVNGVSVQGKWEYNIATKLVELGIKWTKPKTNNDLFKYELDGKIRSYAPDFFLPEYDVYLEVKGHWWGNDKDKMDAVIAQHPDKKVIIIEKDDYERILQGELVWSFQRTPEERDN